MKKLIACLLPCVVATYLNAQEFLVSAPVKPEELSMKECSFDQEADAVVLMHEAYSDHDEQYRLITHHRVRLKILREKGISHADIRIPFYSKENFEFVEVTNGRIYNQGDNGVLQSQDLEKKSIYKKNINKYWSEVVFTFPSVKVGSIIEYTYKSNMANYGGLEDWQFQKSIPVVESRYTLVILPEYEFAYRVQKRDDLPVEIRQEKGSGKIFFSMKNIPGLRNEPYMDARKDYLQMVTFQLSGQNVGYKRRFMTTWEEVIRELGTNPGFGNQVGKSLSGTDEFISLVKLDPSQTNRLTKVYNYLRSNMSWSGIYSKYAVDGVKQAWAKKTGTSGEINLALVTLLREAGIESYPMLVSEREHGKVNADYPFIDQFNTVYAYAIADGKKFYLDGTDRYTPSHIIPHSILNTTALVVNRKAGGLIQIKDEQFEYRDYVNVIGSLSPEGKLNGTVFISSTDYARSQRLYAYKNNMSSYLKAFTGETGNIAIDSFNIKNEETDTLPLQHNFIFSSALNSTGDYSFIPTILFSELDGNPFLSKVRFSNVNFGYRQTFYLNSYINIPDGVSIDALPKAVRLVNADKSISFSRSVLFDEKSRKVVSRISVELKKSLYDTGEYGALHEFYKKMYEYLGEQIVIKKS
ncbi:MAG: DUF3857 domain-containing protein [Chitinophagaceae bacterium]|nr:MAG: DUF3857 domain-containing protein [Chitinophagaceae bacterium]